MRKRSRCVAALACLLACLAAPWMAVRADEAGGPVARLRLFEQPSGETYFALSLTPPRDLLRSAKSSSGAEPGVDVVVLIDTSASQAGPFRTDSLAALRTFLAALGPQDRVKLAAVDLQAVGLTQGFVSPAGTEMNAALARLDRRTPLGSTDMAVALRSALESFGESADRPRSVVYIGDGLSKANLLSTEDFGAVLGGLVRKQVSVHSYAIGPERDMHLLAALANHTGGMMYVDASDENVAETAGVSLADVVHAPVFWPTDSAMPAALREVYPEKTPPLRTDRDTILVGMLDGMSPQTIGVRGTVNGAETEARWSIAVEDAADDLAFLPQLLDVARRDRGLSLPTAGSAGLEEIGRVMRASADALAEMGARELAAGNLEGAKKFAEAARRADPNHPEAKTIHDAVQKSAPRSKMHQIKFQRGAGAPPAEPAAPPPGFGEGFGPERGEFLEETLERQRLEAQILTAEVQEAIRAAREIMGTAPDRAIQDLKFLLQSIEAARDVSADVRVELRNQVLDVIREAGRLDVELAERRAEAERRRAMAVQQQRLISELERTREKIDNLMVRFNVLMEEGEFEIAGEEIAPQVVELAMQNDLPQASVAGISAMTNARLIGNYTEIMAVRHLRQEKFLAALFEVEKAAVPFPDEPPIVYPPPEVWERITIERKKYASIDLAQQGSAEEKIFEALDDVTNFDFIETPLADVVLFIEDTHGISIEIDSKALEDVGLSTDIPVTKTLKGITLRSALRLTLRELELTYMVKDEVLLITTPEEAETQLITKVYPVADLVLPIVSGGLNPFQGGGGLGGGGGGNFNGGGGGGGFGGGGFGGGGFGGGGGGFGGGGGGFFDVKDSLTDDLTLGVGDDAANEDNRPAPEVKKPAPRVERPARQKKAEPISVTAQPGETVEQAWERRFAEADEPFDPASVRETVRQLMHKHRFEEVVAVIQTALRHGQAQTWMYEAMGLAMQAAQAPQEELERALMSAVDFSNDLEGIMYAAVYMSRIGLERRALSLFREVSQNAPHRPEPYVLGLEAARRLGDRDGVQWACLGVLKQSWPKDQRHVAENASRVAEALVYEMRQAGEVEQAANFEQALRQAQARDVRVVVTWTGDADIDLLIEEPSGAVCSLRNQRTPGGGVLLGDAYASGKGAGLSGYREVYECPEGFSGVYRLLLRGIWGKPTAGHATVDIYTHYGSPQEQHIHKQIPVGDKDALILFDLAEGHRQEALEDAQLENLAKAQFEVGRAILAQQLAQTEGSSASRSLAADRAFRERAGALPVRRGRGVGFRPVITTLPEGTNFMATAVISADRRYVRVTATPLFSLIGNVRTFNFVTGQGGQGG